MKPEGANSPMVTLLDEGGHVKKNTAHDRKTAVVHRHARLRQLPINFTRLGGTLHAQFALGKVKCG